MNGERCRRVHGERGAALILAIAFLVVVGGISAAVVSSVTSGLNDRVVLDQARNREYAADAGIETAIAKVRSNMGNGQALAPCTPAPPDVTLNSVTVRVRCAYTPTSEPSGIVHRNAILTARCKSGQPQTCPNTANVIIRAEVGFASQSPAAASTITVSGTYVEAWSVNG